MHNSDEEKRRELMKKTVLPSANFTALPSTLATKPATTTTTTSKGLPDMTPCKFLYNNLFLNFISTLQVLAKYGSKSAAGARDAKP